MKRPPEERFWEKVDKSGDCWLWVGGKTSRGYGSFRDAVGRTVKAHRWSYEAVVGPIPPGLVIDHLCRVPLCVNPEHLEPVTMRENVLRGVSYIAEKAKQTHCIHGHEFTPENTYIWPGNGHRKCLQCQKARDDARYQARKQRQGGNSDE